MWKLLRNLLLVAIMLAGVLKLVLWYEVRQSAARLVSAWAPFAQVQYDSLGVNLDGTVGVGGLSVVFGKGPARSTWRASQVDIETSGPFWLLRRTLMGDESLPARLGLTVKGLQPPAGASPFDWRWLSPLSLVPFETFGCGVVSRLSIADYQRMGLNPGVAQQHLEYHYDAAANALTFTGELSTPPFSAISLSGELQNLDPRSLTPQGWPKLHVAVLTAEYADSGYLVKRNHFCAQQAGASPPAFIDQHLEAIKAYLDGLGVQTTAGVEKIYRELVASGGRMSVQSLPNPGFTLETLSSDAPDALVRQLNLTTRHNDAPPVMLRLAFRSPDAGSDTTPVSAPTSTSVASTAVTPAPPPSAPTTKPAVVVTAPPPSSTAQAPIIAKPPVATAPAPVTPTKGAVVTTPTPRLNATTTTTTVPVAAAAPTPAKTGDPAGLPSTPAPAVGSTLALVWKPTIERLPEAPPPARDYDIIEPGAINSYAGRFVRVLTSGGKKVEGHVIGIGPDGTTLALRVNKPGGSAELQVQRSVIVEIRLPHQKPGATGG